MYSELEFMLECAESAGMTLEELTTEDLKFWQGDN